MPYDFADPLYWFDRAGEMRSRAELMQDLLQTITSGWGGGLWNAEELNDSGGRLAGGHSDL